MLKINFITDRKETQKGALQKGESALMTGRDGVSHYTVLAYYPGREEGTIAEKGTVSMWRGQEGNCVAGVSADGQEIPVRGRALQRGEQIDLMGQGGSYVKIRKDTSGQKQVRRLGPLEKNQLVRFIAE